MAKDKRKDASRNQKSKCPCEDQHNDATNLKKEHDCNCLKKGEALEGAKCSKCTRFLTNNGIGKDKEKHTLLNWSMPASVCC